jgi:hypothetical protein
MTGVGKLVDFPAVSIVELIEILSITFMLDNIFAPLPLSSLLIMRGYVILVMFNI